MEGETKGDTVMTPYAVLPDHVMAVWPGLSPSAKAVAGALGCYMNGAGECWPSVAELQKRSGIHKRQTVTRAIAELEGQGILTVRWVGPWRRVLAWTKLPSGGATKRHGGESTKRTGGESVERHIEQSHMNNPNRTSSCAEQNPETLQGDSKVTIQGNSAPSVPRELQGLALYEKDPKLCEGWPELREAWERAYPGVDIVAEVRKAHAWEVANPGKRKKHRARFLGSWLSRAKPSPMLGENDDLPPGLLDVPSWEEMTPKLRAAIEEANREAEAAKHGR